MPLPQASAELDSLQEELAELLLTDLNHISDDPSELERFHIKLKDLGSLYYTKSSALSKRLKSVGSLKEAEDLRRNHIRRGDEIEEVKDSIDSFMKIMGLDHVSSIDLCSVVSRRSGVSAKSGLSRCGNESRGSINSRTSTPLDYTHNGAEILDHSRTQFEGSGEMDTAFITPEADLTPRDQDKEALGSSLQSGTIGGGSSCQAKGISVENVAQFDDLTGAKPKIADLKAHSSLGISTEVSPTDRRSAFKNLKEHSSFFRVEEQQLSEIVDGFGSLSIDVQSPKAIVTEPAHYSMKVSQLC